MQAMKCLRFSSPAFFRIIILATFAALVPPALMAQVPSKNVNMVLGTTWPAGDPFAQRQNEPSMAVSTRNPQHLLGGANDYRTVDIPNTGSPNEHGDAWLGVYTSLDGGESWKSTLHPCYPQDTWSGCGNSPLKGFAAATDPTVRAGSNGMFYYAGLVFARGTNAPSGVFVSTFNDLNNKPNASAPLQKPGDAKGSESPIAYLNTTMIDSGTSGQFLDKPWVAVDIPRAGAGTCSINVNGVQQKFAAGNVYMFYTLFNGSQKNPSSKINVSVSKNCGASWSKPTTISQSSQLNQGTVAAIDPKTGTVYVAWRQEGSGNQNQQDQILYAYSSNGGGTWTSGVAYTFPANSPFDQDPNGVTFRSEDLPSLAIDANGPSGSGRVWIAFSQRITTSGNANPALNGLSSSRIMLVNGPVGGGPKSWSAPSYADGSINNSMPGFQFMPTLAYAYGKLMLAFYDSRRDNQMSTLACQNGTGGQGQPACVVVAQDVTIPGSLRDSNPASVFTPTISDPTNGQGLRHTIDVYGSYIDTTQYDQGQTSTPPQFPATRISQYTYFFNSSNVPQQGQFNVPNFDMFADGTIPFMGDYIDAAAVTMLPDGKGGWTFNTQSSNPPVFHITWTDNRDVLPPSDGNWTIYVPPNANTGTANGPSFYNASVTEPACTVPGHSGDRNQNVYTARLTTGLLVRFQDNSKDTTTIQRAFSLNVRNTNTPVTNPNDFWYRVFLNPVVSAQSVNCSNAIPGGGTASFADGSCFADIDVPPSTTIGRGILVAGTNGTVNVLVTQISPDTQDPNTGKFLTGTGTIINGGLQSAVAINNDPTNPALVNPDLGGSNIAGPTGAYDPSNPDSSSPYQGLTSITNGEAYDPSTDAPDATSPAVVSPAVTSPAVVSPAVTSPAVTGLTTSPAVTSPAVVEPTNTSPAVTAVQYVSPAVVSPAVTSPAVTSPAVVTPEYTSPAVTSPAVTSVADGGITDYTWRLNNHGNTSNTYNAKEFAKAAGNLCGGNTQCQLIIHKVNGNPTPNIVNGTAGCSLTVSVQDQTVASIPFPSFSTSDSVGTVDTNPDPRSNPNITIPSGDGVRVTLRIFGLNTNQAPPLPYKTVGVTTPDTGQNTPAASLTITSLELPIAVVGQPYTTNGAPATSGNTEKLSSIGGFPGGVSWYVPAVPGVSQTPPAQSTNIGGTGLTLLQSGQINPDTVSVSPGTYNFDAQAQDTAQPQPSLDVQPLNLFVNQFSISAVTVSSNTNSTANTAYVNHGDTLTVTVALTSSGPTTPRNASATLQVNAAVAGGTTPPSVSCVSTTVQPVSSFAGTADIVFTCTNAGGNGYITFTANATAHYLSFPSGIFNTTATAPTFYTPQQVPSAQTPNVLVDTVNPTLSWVAPTTNPTAFDASGKPWYNTPVVETYTTSDNLSGVYSRVPVSPATVADFGNTEAIRMASQGAGITGQVTVTDFALNVAQPGSADSPTSPAFNIDMTKPTISGQPDRPPNPNLWYRAPVTVHFTASDPAPQQPPQAGAQPLASGVNSMTLTPDVTLTQDGYGQQVPGSVSDYATNANSTTVTGINIDQTPPTIAGSPDRAPNAYGWYNAPVTVSFLCADTFPANVTPMPPATATPSGVASCTGPFTLTNDRAAQSVPGTATDKAGNTAATAVSGINIDQTPPVIAAPTATAGGNSYAANTWTNQNVVVTFTCSDNLSGPLTSNPLISGLPALGATVTYASTGLTSTATVTLTAETSGTTLTANCQDLAGNNAAPQSFGPIMIDKTPPQLVATGEQFDPASNQDLGPYTSNTWTANNVTVTYTCTDNTVGHPNSGAPASAGSVTEGQTNLALGAGNLGWSVTAALTSPNAPNGTAFTGTCSDAAGNSATPSPVSFAVLIDRQSPAVGITSPANTMYILNTPITATYACTETNGDPVPNCVGSYGASSAQPSSYAQVATGGQFSDSPVGLDTFAVTSADAAGNVQTGSVQYMVVYNFTGFQAPLQPAVMMNALNPPAPPQPSDSGSFTVGTTIPVAWQLQDANQTYISDPASLTSVVAIPNPSCAGAAAGTGTTLYDGTTGVNAFSYESYNNRFVFNWNTTGMAAGCYNLVVTTKDTAQWSTIVHLVTIARFAYVTNYNSASVTTETISGPGAITTTGSAPAGGNANGGAADSTGKFLYVANRGSNSISAYIVDSNTGALTSIPGAPFADPGGGPSMVSVHPSGQFLYAANFIGSGVTAYSIDSTTAALTAISTYGTDLSPFAIAIDPAGKYLFEAGSGHANVFSIDATGALTEVFSTTNGISQSRGVTVDPTGKFVYISSYDTNSIAAFTLDSTSGTLSPVGVFTAGSGPHRIVTDPAGKLLYATNVNSNNVSVFAINQSGALTEIAGSPFATGSYPHWIAIDPNGSIAYVTDVASSDVDVYSINSTTGALNLIGTSTTNISGPTSIVLVK